RAVETSEPERIEVLRRSVRVVTVRVLRREGRHRGIHPCDHGTEASHCEVGGRQAVTHVREERSELVTVPYRCAALQRTVIEECARTHHDRFAARRLLRALPHSVGYREGGRAHR